jgi:hypothetical protein
MVVRLLLAKVTQGPSFDFEQFYCHCHLRGDPLQVHLKCCTLVCLEFEPKSGPSSRGESKLVLPDWLLKFVELRHDGHKTIAICEDDGRMAACMLFLNGVREVLCDYRETFFRTIPGQRSRLWESYFDNLCQLADLFDKSEAKFVKLIKSWCAWAAAVSLQQSELPSDFSQIVHGPLLRLIKRLINTGSPKRRVKVGWSLGQVKRACAPINSAFISEKLADHAKILSTEPKGLSREILAELESVTAEVLKDFSWSAHDIIGNPWLSPVVGYDPSTAACFEMAAAGGGAASYLYDISHHPLQGDELLQITSAQNDQGLHSIYYHPTDYQLIVKELSDFSDKYREGKGAPWVVQGILEPLKLRIITKGPAVLQWLGKGLQKALHGYLRELPMFAFIGHPVDPVTLENFLSQTYSTFAEGCPEFVSGDYSAATDKLNIHVTLTIFDMILSKFKFIQYDSRNELTRFLTKEVQRPSRLIDCLCSLLNKGTLIYRDDNCPSQEDIESHGLSGYYDQFGTAELEVPQRNGQLMGSILSFPILCIANFACVLMASRRMPPEEFGSDFVKKSFLYNLSRGMCQINGDDILFPVSGVRMYNHWSSFLKVFGFEKSLGKNWLHSRFFTINSELYSVSRDSSKASTFRSEIRSTSWTKIEYFAAGLLTGQHKVVGRSEGRTLPMSSVLDLVLVSAVNPQRAYRRFLFYNRDWVKSVTQNGMINIGLPIPLGGLGVNLTKYGVGFSTTKLQRCVARAAFDLLKSGDLRLQQYKNLTVHLSSSGEKLNSMFSFLSELHGSVSVRPTPLCTDPIELLLTSDGPKSIGPLAYRKPVRESDDNLVISGAGLYRHILKRCLPRASLSKDFDLDSFQVFSLQKEELKPIGSDDQTAKTVPFIGFDRLNTSVLRRYILLFPSWVDQTSYTMFFGNAGMSRDCTAVGVCPKWTWNPYGIVTVDVLEGSSSLKSNFPVVYV